MDCPKCGRVPFPIGDIGSACKCGWDSSEGRPLGAESIPAMLDVMRQLRDEIAEKDDAYGKLRDVLLHWIGTTDPEMIHEELERLNTHKKLAPGREVCRWRRVTGGHLAYGCRPGGQVVSAPVPETCPGCGLRVEVGK